MKVYLVEDKTNAPGRIYGVFVERKAARQLAEDLEDSVTSCEVVPRTLIYGQAPIRGYNP